MSKVPCNSNLLFYGIGCLKFLQAALLSLLNFTSPPLQPDDEVSVQEGEEVVNTIEEEHDKPDAIVGKTVTDGEPKPISEHVQLDPLAQSEMADTEPESIVTDELNRSIEETYSTSGQEHSAIVDSTVDIQIVRIEEVETECFSPQDDDWENCPLDFIETYKIPADDFIGYNLIKVDRGLVMPTATTLVREEYAAIFPATLLFRRSLCSYGSTCVISSLSSYPCFIPHDFKRLLLLVLEWATYIFDPSALP
ncbi:uncharacterized protein LOC143853690 [Tasmannia lanceolata]|uniref:uncharacterized protein LOC143853690 n=1 Tax=Tasmannia lanceolata TaxID=3420 RepID=UPI004063729D